MTAVIAKLFRDLTSKSVVPLKRSKKPGAAPQTAHRLSGSCDRTEQKMAFIEAAKVLRLKTTETMDATMLEQLRQRVAATYTEMAKKSQQAEVKSHNMAIFRSFFEVFYSLSCSGIDQGAEISEEQLNKSLEKCLGEIRKLLNSKKYTKCMKCRAPVSSQYHPVANVPVITWSSV